MGFHGYQIIMHIYIHVWATLSASHSADIQYIQYI